MSVGISDGATEHRIDGDAEGLVDVATAGLLDAERLVIYSPTYEHDPQFLRDLPADASLVVLAEEQNDGRILSTDARDFKTYRWKSKKPFTNLLDAER